MFHMPNRYIFRNNGYTNFKFFQVMLLLEGPALEPPPIIIAEQDAVIIVM